MKKVLAVIVSVFSLMCLLISCSNDGSVDEAFNCIITFDGNGATAGEMSVQTEGIGKEARLSENTYERTKYLFTGWNTEQDGSGTAYTDGQKISLTGNITLFAQWEVIPIILDSSMGGWTDGNVYVLNSNVSIFGQIIVSGSVTLILNDGYALSALNGIRVDEGNSLTIEASGEGTGILEAIGQAGNAGIGGYYNCNSGTIIINGGTVNANAETSGAGIGGGLEGGSGGTIIINGGTVNAIADQCAGIGGGRQGSGGTIIINGGTVEASSKEGGAGIGGGKQGSGGTITINGGTVEASSKDSGAGIGGGDEGSGGTITINGGIVNASSDFVAGIGRGYNGDSDGTLTLGEGVTLEVSTDNANWSDYDGTTRQRYMRTK